MDTITTEFTTEFKQRLCHSFTLNDGTTVKGATVLDLKEGFKTTKFKKIPFGTTTQHLLRKEGMHVVVAKGKRNGRGKEISFWTIKS